MSEAIGMMDKAYFVGKVVILQWLNELLEVSVFLFNLSATPRQDRAVRNWRGVLRCDGRPVPELVPFQQSQMGVQERV